MKITTCRSAGLTFTCFLACPSVIRAHSWVEQLSVVAPNGTFVGLPGYARGNVLRTAPDFTDVDMTWLVPPNSQATGNIILPTQLMCIPTQSIGNQTVGSPALVAAPGDFVALRYQENGHVTEPTVNPDKPLGSGTVYIYGTSKATDSDLYLDIHKVWNAEGTGGDGRGVLLATQYFDDGQCYQVDNLFPISVQRQAGFPHDANILMGANLWCQTDVQLPTNITGKYTLYWVWDWPTLSDTAAITLNQSYTTCMDIELVDTSDASKEPLSFVVGQNLNFAAISSQLATAFVAPTTWQTYNAEFASTEAPPESFVTTGAGPPTVALYSFQFEPAETETASLAELDTVTVYASPVIEYVTVTVTAGAAAIEPSASTDAPAASAQAAASPSLASTSATSLAAASVQSSAPSVEPFLADAGEASTAALSSISQVTVTKSGCPATTSSVTGTSKSRRRRRNHARHVHEAN